MDTNQRVKEYIAVRDAIRALDEAHDKKRKKLLEMQEYLGGMLSKFMHANNVENLRTDAGTCYVSVRYTAPLADPEEFMNFIITNSGVQFV